MVDLLVPALIGALILGVLYRRGRRLFVRQTIAPGGLIVWSLIPTALAFVVAGLPSSTTAIRLAGLALGAPLALAGIALTKFEQEEEVRRYTPNPILAAVIFSMFVGRWIYRYLGVRAIVGDASPGRFDLSTSFRDPVARTLLLALLIYYALYDVGLLSSALRSRAR